MSEIPATLKAARAVGGDDFFVERLRVLCSILGVEYTDRLAYLTAVDVADHIQVDDVFTVTTSGVTDAELEAAVIVAASDQEPTDAQPVLARLAVVQEAVVGLVGDHLEATGRGMGELWQQPGSAQDGYPRGWTAVVDGVLFESLRDFNVWHPTFSIEFWRAVGDEPADPVPWTEQQWPKGSLVIHEGHVWLAVQDVLAPNWAPGPTLAAYWEDQGPLETVTEP